MEYSRKVYTIGHSVMSAADFLGRLGQHGISCVVDVRSTPFCKYAPHFNKEELRFILQRQGIIYVAMSEEFGARREDLELYDASGILDFARTRRSKLFLRGVERLAKGIDGGQTVALMCLEKNALDCHRGILVAKGLADAGFEIYHIGPEGETMTHEELERDLVRLYFPDVREVSLFGDPETKQWTWEEKLREAYRLRNTDIGFHKEDEKEVPRM